MSYTYTKKTGKRPNIPEFSVGTHEAVIENVEMTESKKELPMFSLKITGEEGERGFYNLTFGTDYTENFLDYILTSIEDNGEEIPEINFDYNQETADFLTGKAVYIEVKAKTYQGKKVNRITAFLNQEEFFDDDEEDKE